MQITNAVSDSKPSAEEVAQALEVLEAAGIRGARLLSRCCGSVTDLQLGFAELIQQVRRNRSEIIGEDVFGEASWDILLALYVAKRSHYRMTITAVCNESGVPQTTALRWLQHLVDAHLVQREANPLDRRAVYVELTSRALEHMDQIMDTVLNQNT